MVESQPSKLLVAGSIPVSRSIIFCRSYILRVVNADVAQLVEHSLGKGEVIGSIPIISSIFLARPEDSRPSLAEGCCGFGGPMRAKRGLPEERAIAGRLIA